MPVMLHGVGHGDCVITDYLSSVHAWQPGQPAMTSDPVCLLSACLLSAHTHLHLHHAFSCHLPAHCTRDEREPGAGEYARACCREMLPLRCSLNPYQHVFVQG